MLNQQLNLTKHQQQVLDDLGIDAWYLQPLVDHSEDTQQSAISEIVQALSASLQQSDNITTSAAPHSPLAASEHSTAINTNTESPVAAKKPVEHSVATNEEEHHACNESACALPQNTLKNAQQKSNPLPPSIELTAINPLAPVDEKINFPTVERLAKHSWQGVENALNQLNAEGSATHQDNKKETATNQGFGHPNADWFFVMPPPLQNDSVTQCLTQPSKELMSEWLGSSGKSLDEVYITPMIKTFIKIPRDPDNEWLASHLSILQSEIGLVNPKRIFLMGRQPCQSLLGSSAPLSELMKVNYQLSCADDISSGLVPMTCFPSLDYFCKLPSEKSWLWKASKSLIQ